MGSRAAHAGPRSDFCAANSVDAVATSRLRRLTALRELPEHVLENAAVDEVVLLLRRVDAHLRARIRSCVPSADVAVTFTSLTRCAPKPSMS